MKTQNVSFLLCYNSICSSFFASSVKTVVKWTDDSLPSVEIPLMEVNAPADVTDSEKELIALAQSESGRNYAKA